MESQKRECEQAVKEANALLLQAGGSAQNFKAQTDEFFLITPRSEQVYFDGCRDSSILTNSDQKCESFKWKKDEKFDFEDKAIVQVNDEVYTIGEDLSVTKYTDLQDSDTMEKIETGAVPPTEKVTAGFSVACHRNEQILVTGGRNEEEYECQRTLWQYGIQKNKWERGPDLNRIRCAHASQAMAT